MNSDSLSHLADQTLLRDFDALVARDSSTTAAILAYLAEMDERKLYVPAGYASMFLFLVREKHMSEETAYRRIRVARAARRFPAIFPALADGRLILTTVLMLSPHLTRDTADALLAAAEYKSKAEIDVLLAERFPRPDLPTVVSAIAPTVAPAGLAALPVEIATRRLAPREFRQLAPEPVATILDVPAQQLAPERVVESRAKLAPLSPGRFALQVTVDQETHDLLRYAQALLGHGVPSGDVAAVLKRALGALVHDLERQKFARGVRTRPRRGAPKGRHIPAEVRRTVWQRDGGQCTFVSEHGKRCESTSRLEFDHIDPVARGGQASVAQIRLRCRAHNQYAAECVFGAGFMQHKREQARTRAAQARARAQEQTPAGASAP